MKRIILKLCCILSGILFLVFAIIAAFSVNQTLSRVSGIIGGAGTPTLRFALQQAATPIFYAVLFFFLSLGTGLALVLGRKP